MQLFILTLTQKERQKYGSMYKWLQANKDKTVSDTKYNVMKLEPDHIYEFHIAAQNKAGVGPVSEPTQVEECVGEHSSCL